MSVASTISLDLRQIPLEGELPVAETAEAVLTAAAEIGASDLFILSEQEGVQTAVRHMGINRQLRSYSTDFGRRLISHLKVQGGMDISDRVHPGEGRWVFEREDATPLDIRMNSIPTLFGEDLTCRILNRETGLRDLDHLGLLAHEYHSLISLLKSSSGLILISGPTGSGKTTTMYSCLRHLNDGRRKINTLEDPVEYVLPGARQSQVNLKQDVDFASLLVACLRQAPDIIMIGEIRDPETASTAVRAANSGHLVLATLHAPYAAATVQSMLALGVNPHFLATSLVGVISQRLMRRLCPHCRTPIDMSAAGAMFDDVRRWLADGEGRVMYSPGRCEHCLFTGYSSQMCLCEILVSNDRIQEMLSKDEPAHLIGKAAVEAGMIDFQRGALLRVARGETTTEEMFRVLPFDRAIA
ncbi:type II/IV secretion system protein [bacterium]|nr:type II/IV secretion system protein [bacterium]